ncbi:hypothetical protein Micbo1qcDRAFT_66040 [Microdochium bolleyi]|uniref:Uncharacterized protein n=1 Tax=Microdochium bolleyi TaxID=196109 RepID=A0A136J2Z9_9PEZI|nr:hypothetical protein Micbo1qcDRAFT_66040 [Microdochium bolleyi]
MHKIQASPQNYVFNDMPTRTEQARRKLAFPFDTQAKPRCSYESLRSRCGPSHSSNCSAVGCSTSTLAASLPTVLITSLQRLTVLSTRFSLQSPRHSNAPWPHGALSHGELGARSLDRHRSCSPFASLPLHLSLDGDKFCLLVFPCFCPLGWPAHDAEYSLQDDRTLVDPHTLRRRVRDDLLLFVPLLFVFFRP